MPSKEPKGRPPKRRRGWLVLLVALLALVIAGPTIIANTPLRDAAIASLLPAEAGSLTTSGGSFGWTGVTALTDVELRDAQNNVLLSASRIELGSSLLDLITNPKGPSNLTVESPIVSLVVDPNGSNLERFLTALENGQGSKQQETIAEADADTSRAMAIQLSNAELRISDLTTGERWLANEVDFSVSGLNQGFASIEAIGSGKVGPYYPPQAAVVTPPQGTFSFRLGKAEDGRRLAQVSLVSAPLSLAGPVLRRSDPAARVAGWVGIEGQAAWAPGLQAKDFVAALFAEGFSSAGRTTVTNLRYNGAYTGGEPLIVPQFDSPWSLASSGQRLAISQLRVASELGSVVAQGSVAKQEAEAWFDSVLTPPSDLQLTGELDIARLASIAPDVLRLQQGVTIDSGRVRADLTSSSATGTMRLNGYVRTENLTGQSRGRPIAWNEPLELSFVATQAATAGAWWVDEFRCRSSFLSAQASGEASGVQGEGSFDLNQLSSELRKFVDLGDWRLAGTGQTSFQWRRQAQDLWAATATGQMRQLAVGPAQSPVVSEQQVNFQGSVTGRGTDLKSLDSADVTLTVDADRLQVELKEAPGESNPFRFELSGDLASWVQRLKVASPSSFYLDGIAIAGQIQSTGEGALDNEVVQVSKIQATATNLAIDSADGLRLREPQVNFAADFAWNANTGVLASGESQFVGSALTFSTREVTLSPNGPPHNSRGEAVFRGDLGRLVAWFPAAAPGPRWSAEGAFTGRVSLRGEAGGARATASLKGQRFALYQIDSNGQRLVWDEPSLEGALLARLINSTPSAEGQQTEIELEQLTLSSNTLTASATGRIGDVAQMRAVDLAGDIEYDLQQLSPLLWPRLSDSVKLLGKDRATFQVRSDDLTGAGYEGLAARIEAPWQGADLFGLPVGPGRLVGVLDRGVVRFDPLAVSVGEGSLNAVLSSKLYPSPTTVSLAPGPFISGVAISPEVAERFLKYIAPVLADATRIRGNFSLGFSEFNVMTRDVQNSKMSGNLDIHSAEVAPGPAVAEWVALARQVRGVVRDGVESVAQESTTPVLTVRQQTIPFQMANGRVYHRDLIFDVGDVVMTSEGSVGIDETLDLLLTIPIQEEWVQRRPVLLAGLRGQAIRIPVRGTFSRPELDREAFRQISRQLLQSAAEGAINQGLDLLLERLRSR